MTDPALDALLAENEPCAADYLDAARRCHEVFPGDPVRWCYPCREIALVLALREARANASNADDAANRRTLEAELDTVRGAMRAAQQATDRAYYLAANEGTFERPVFIGDAIEALGKALREARAERDDFQRRLNDAQDDRSRWHARMMTAEAEVARLKERVLDYKEAEQHVLRQWREQEAEVAQLRAENDELSYYLHRSPGEGLVATELDEPCECEACVRVRALKATGGQP